MDKEKSDFFIFKYGWLGGLIGALGLLYLSAPDDVQISFRRVAPEALRAGLIGMLPTAKWVIASYVITGLCTCWGAIACHFRSSWLKGKNESLLAENEGLRFKAESAAIDCYDFFSRYLIGYYAKLKLGADERVSLYLFDSNNFICVGRYSSNEVYRKKPSRLYGISQGCIAKTWQRNKFQDSGAPDPVSCLGEYFRYQKNSFGYDEEQLSEMRMKSRSYSGIRIKNPRSEAVAVLLFESTEPSGLPIGKIDRLIDLDEQRRLGALIDSLERHMPSLADAEQEGF